MKILNSVVHFNKTMLRRISLIVLVVVTIFYNGYVVTASPIVINWSNSVSFVREKDSPTSVYNDYCMKRMRCGSSQTSRINPDEIDHRIINELGEKCPESSLAERVRFVTKYKDKASEMLQSYIEWRNQCDKYKKQTIVPNDIITSSNILHKDIDLSDAVTTEDYYTIDKEDWDNAVHIAKQLTPTSQTKKKSKVDNNNNNNEEIPQCICMYQRRESNNVLSDWFDKFNRRVIVYRPSLMDEKRMSLSTYASAIAIYIDSKLQRESNERVTVLIDLRPGFGWGNIPVSQLLLSSFIRDISTSLVTLLPERMTTTILFPVPGSLRWIWNVAAKFMDPITTQKIRLISGSASIDSELPNDQLQEYFHDDFLNLLEKHRRDNFGSSK